METNKVSVKHVGRALELSFRCKVERSPLVMMLALGVVGTTMIVLATLGVVRWSYAVVPLVCSLGSLLLARPSEATRAEIRRRVVLDDGILRVSAGAWPYVLRRALRVEDVDRFEPSFDEAGIEAVLRDGRRRALRFGVLEEGCASEIVDRLEEERSELARPYR